MYLLEGSWLDGMVAKSKMFIYGLKQSPSEWYFQFVKYLGPFEFVITAWDPCVLIHKSENLFLALYVDYIALYGATGELKEQTINVLNTEFKVNDMGELNWLLWISITWIEDGIALSQITFIKMILNRVSMQDQTPVWTRIDPNRRLNAIAVNEHCTDTTAYKPMIRSLTYLVTVTWLDLAYAITHLSQRNESPSLMHHTAAKQVLRYLQGAKDQHPVLYTEWSTQNDCIYGCLLW